MQIAQPWKRGFERLRQHSSDLFAGSTGAIAAVPDGMAASVIVGVAPVHGLYASAFGPILGGLVSATPLLVVSTTSAAAVASSELISGNEAAARLDSLRSSPCSPASSSWWLASVAWPASPALFCTR